MGFWWCEQNELWMEMKAGLFNTDLLVAQTDSLSALGAAVIAAFGAGFYDTLQDAVDRMKSTYRTVRHEKYHKNKYLAKCNKIYKNIYPSLKELNEKLQC